MLAPYISPCFLVLYLSFCMYPSLLPDFRSPKRIDNQTFIPPTVRYCDDFSLPGAISAVSFVCFVSSVGSIEAKLDKNDSPGVRTVAN